MSLATICFRKNFILPNAFPISLRWIILSSSLRRVVGVKLNIQGASRHAGAHVKGVTALSASLRSGIVTGGVDGGVRAWLWKHGGHSAPRFRTN